MYTRETLEGKRVVELVQVCKELNIPYCNNKGRLPKPQLINRICENVRDTEDINKKINEASEAYSVETYLTKNSNDKTKYLENIQVGILIAFREPETNKLNTAKVVKKNVKAKKLKVETSYGAEFIIDFDSVCWVKTGKRWPKGIYNELKGIN